MLAVEGTYYDGKVKLFKKIKTSKPVQVIVTFLDEITSDSPKKLTKDKFNFDKTRTILKDVDTSFSETLINERRQNI